MGILLSNSVCWAAFERVGLGGYQQAALSWRFRWSKLLWPLLLPVSILLVLRRYGITEGVLVGDDSDKQRAKVTQRIFGAHSVFDTKTGGYFNGQTMVFLFLVIPKVIGHKLSFFRPCQALQLEGNRGQTRMALTFHVTH